MTLAAHVALHDDYFRGLLRVMRKDDYFEAAISRDARITGFQDRIIDEMRYRLYFARRLYQASRYRRADFSDDARGVISFSQAPRKCMYDGGISFVKNARHAEPFDIYAHAVANYFAASRSSAILFFTALRFLSARK